MSDPDRKVHEPEIVGREDEPAGGHDDHLDVKVRRVQGRHFFGQSVFTASGNPEEIRRRVARIRARMWLWFAAFAVVTVGCFYGAYVTELFFVQVVLILTGGLTATVTAFLVFVLWGLHRLARR